MNSLQHAPALEVKDAIVEYPIGRRRNMRAVDRVSLSVGRGEVVGLVGESGCGKSSLGRAIVGLTPMTKGTVLLDGREVAALTRKARPVTERGLQMVFQDPYSSLNPRRRVWQQLADGWRDRPGENGEDDHERACRLLRDVELPASAAERFPHEFSGGQRQRIAIARALGADPDVVVADEPVSALDASTRAHVAELLVDATTRGMGLLMISHDLSGLRAIADRIAVMYFGRIVEVGPTESLWRNPQHEYTRTLIAAIPRLGRNATIPEAPQGEQAEPIVTYKSTIVSGARADEELVEVEPGWLVARPTRSGGLVA